MAAPGGKLPAGKLPVKLLERFLRKYSTPDESVVVGPSVGLDAAVVEWRGGYLIAKTDPVTFVAEDIATYTLHVNANDIASMGGEPRWFLATVLLPEGETTRASAEKVFRQLHRACKDIGVSLCGGHTEITPGVSRPIVVGQMLGTVAKKDLVTAAGARPGDELILTKGVPIEAASIIAREKAGELKKAFSGKFVSRCKNYIRNPGISVLADMRAVTSRARPSAMHDPTEGGLATGVAELAIASGCGALIEREKVPLLPEAEKLCEHYGIDPLGAIASGALLVSLPPAETPKALKGLREAGIRGSRIGSIKKKGYGVRITEGGRTRPLRLFERDEITRVL